MKTLPLVLLIVTTPCFFLKDHNVHTMNTIEEILSGVVENKEAPSVQYVYFNKDSVLYAYRSGYSNLQEHLKADGNTTYNGFSVTKTFTAVAIMQLAEKGLLDLDKPARDYLPDSPIAEAITIRHLLTHTAGLPNPLPISWIHLASEHESFDRNAFFRPILAKHGKPEREPGSKFRYSNLGYLFLGQIIESVSGLSFEEYVRTNILEKLEVKPGELGFDVPHSLLQAKGYHNKRSLSMLALGFMLDKSKYMDQPSGKWKPFREVYVNGAPYGGIIGTVDGFVKYGQALLGDEEKLLSSPYRDLMFRENTTSDGKATGMCMSWFKGELKNHTYFMHAGGGGGYYCELRLYPELQSGSFIVFNRSGFSNEKFLDKVDVFLLD